MESPEQLINDFYLGLFKPVEEIIRAIWLLLATLFISPILNYFGYQNLVPLVTTVSVILIGIFFLRNVVGGFEAGYKEAKRAATYLAGLLIGLSFVIGFMLTLGGLLQVAALIIGIVYGFWKGGHFKWLIERKWPRLIK